jgi:hypothetical protein
VWAWIGVYPSLAAIVSLFFSRGISRWLGLLSAALTITYWIVLGQAM